jgi:hypothetical protein
MTGRKTPQSSRSDQDSHLDANQDYPPRLTHYQLGMPWIAYSNRVRQSQMILAIY